MAENVYLFLKVNGTDVQGEGSPSTFGRENSIECTRFDQSVRVARQTGTGQATGRRTYEPIVFVKRIDKSSPLIAKALAQNAKIDAVFKFFRAKATSGEIEHFYTIEIKNGRVSSFRDYVLDTLEPENGPRPPLEEVSIVFHTIKWTYVDGGITFEDTWSGNSVRGGEAVARRASPASPPATSRAPSRKPRR